MSCVNLYFSPRCPTSLVSVCPAFLQPHTLLFSHLCALQEHYCITVGVNDATTETPGSAGPATGTGTAAGLMHGFGFTQ